MPHEIGEYRVSYLGLLPELDLGYGLGLMLKAVLRLGEI